MSKLRYFELFFAPFRKKVCEAENENIDKEMANEDGWWWAKVHDKILPHSIFLFQTRVHIKGWNLYKMATH